MWVYSDYRLAGNERLAALTQADIIKIDPGEPGSIETSFVANRIPAITLELGPPVTWGHEFIQRGYEFIFRLLADLYMIPSSSSSSSSSPSPGHPISIITPDLSHTFIATNRVDVPCTKSGWAQARVAVLDDVTRGQEIATVYDSWGAVVERVRAPADSRILQVKTDPAVEAGAVVIVLVNNETSMSTGVA